LKIFQLDSTTQVVVDDEGMVMGGSWII